MAHKSGRSETLTSPVIRGAYIFAHEKRTKDAEGKPLPPEKQNHEFIGIVPKLHADPAQCANYQLFSRAAMEAISRCADFGGQFPAGGNWPIQDGDDPTKLAKYPWRKGSWIVKFSANWAPKVAILQNGQPVEIPARRVGATELYKGGDYLVTSFNAFTYDNRQKGVKFNFEGILFVGAGETIGPAQRSVDQMFGGAAGMAVPQAPGVPTAAPAMPAPSYAPQPSAPTMAPPAAPQPMPTAPAAPAYAAPMPPMAPPAAAPMPPAMPGGMPLPPIPGR